MYSWCAWLLSLFVIVCLLVRCTYVLWHVRSILSCCLCKLFGAGAVAYIVVVVAVVLYM